MKSTHQTLLSNTAYICIVIGPRHSYIHAFLVMLLLFATTGVTLSKHYCMGKLMSVEINDHAHGCQGADEDRMPCCEDTIEELRVEQLQKTVFAVDLETTSHLIHEVTYVLVDVDAQIVTYPFIDLHAPPLLVKDIPVLVQSFLI